MTDKQRSEIAGMCALSNLIAYIALTIITISLIWKYIDNAVIGGILTIASVVVCAYFEKKVIVYPVNAIVTFCAKVIIKISDFFKK